MLDRQRIDCVLVAQHFGQFLLVIEQQPVFAPAGQGVQGEANAPEKGLAVFEALQLARCQEIVVDEFGQRRGPEMPLGHPADHLDVAQPARAAFDVGFEVVGRVVVAMVALDLLVAFLCEETVRRPHPVRRDEVLHCVEKRRGPGQQPGFHQGRDHGQIGGCLIMALRERAHAVADFEPDVPQGRDEARERVLGAVR